MVVGPFEPAVEMVEFDRHDVKMISVVTASFRAGRWIDTLSPVSADIVLRPLLLGRRPEGSAGDLVFGVTGILHVCERVIVIAHHALHAISDAQTPPALD
jgi:hypothetical protein